MYEPNIIYHVYNHTNNKELLFRQEADYLVFLNKIRKHLLPCADILAYCLMPTHFHVQLMVNSFGLQRMSVIPTESNSRQQNIHSAFRTILSSYTQGTNKKYDRRGSLLRAKTKYKPAYTDFVPDDWELQEDIPFTRYIPYLLKCFDYIHENPVAAGLVEKAIDWPYSSASDYEGLRNGTLCSYSLSKRLLGVSKK